MTKEQYYLMCQEMGWEVNEKELPPEVDDFSPELQQAMLLFNVLPDKIEGMNGIWLGKDYSGLGDIMENLDIIDPKESFFLLQEIIKIFYKHYEDERKTKESLNKVHR